MPDAEADRTAAEADRRLEEALQARGARDPREFYRERLRALKQSDPTAYQEAVAYYRDRLIPEVASGEKDPLEAWTEYGCFLARAVAPGRTVAVDVTGRRLVGVRPAGRDALLLHLPDEKGARALLVGLPPELSPAQRATYEVMVRGKQRLPETA